jgi:hypothetical protein
MSEATIVSMVNYHNVDCLKVNGPGFDETIGMSKAATKTLTINPQ